MTEQEQSSLNSLTSALLKASGEESPAPLTNTAKPAHRAALRRVHNEEQGECPKCGYTAPLDDFDNGDSDSDSDGFETDEEAGSTSGDDPAENLAKALLKSANASQAKQSQTPQTGKALTAEEATNLIKAALKNLRNR